MKVKSIAETATSITVEAEGLTSSVPEITGYSIEIFDSDRVCFSNYFDEPVWVAIDGASTIIPVDILKILLPWLNGKIARLNNDEHENKS